MSSQESGDGVSKEQDMEDSSSTVTGGHRALGKESEQNHGYGLLASSVPFKYSSIWQRHKIVGCFGANDRSFL